MKNKILFIVACMLSLSMAQMSVAQMKGGVLLDETIPAGNQGQQRDQDQTQDPPVHEYDPIQDRDRDQDRLQDPEFEQPREENRIQNQIIREEGNDQNTASDNAENVEERLIMFQEKATSQAQSAEQLRNMLLIRHQELADESEDFDAPAREILQNQNQFRKTAYALLAVGPLASGANGEQVRFLGQQMQEQMKEMVQAEYELQNQSRLSRMFVGGDDENGGALLERCERVREYIRDMNQYVDECPGCSEQIRETLREQLRLAESECSRLEELGRDEINSRGIFGVLFGWMR